MNTLFTGASELLHTLSVEKEHIDFFSKRLSRVLSDPELLSAFKRLSEEYWANEKLPMGDLIPRLDEIAASMDENRYVVHYLFLLANAENLRLRYAARGMSDETYHNTLGDMRSKLYECLECKGVPGTFVLDWYDCIFRMQCFGAGRFLYQLYRLKPEDAGRTLSSGRKLIEGELLLNIHIPSYGTPLTDEVRHDSYRRAYRFFSGFFDFSSPMIYRCSSWLLYPAHREFLPKKSNILRLMDDFELVSFGEKERFKDGWRIFGRYADLPPEKLPTDTSLRAAYARRLRSGGKTGAGTGFLLFDGEKIVR
jgi:hypothetical protein